MSLDIFQYQFMQNAIMAAVLCSAACGIIGALVVSRRIVFIAGGISHSAYGGVGLAILFGFNPLIGAGAFALGSALAIGAITRRSKERIDSLIGMVWAFGMGVGIIAIALKPGYSPDINGYLFGSILAITRAELAAILVLDILIFVAIRLFYNQLLAISFDEEYAEASGMPVAFYHYLLLALTALTVVMLIRAVGIILMIALLTIPAVIAAKYSSDLKKIMVGASFFAAAFSLGGLLLSYALGAAAGINLPSGACIIILAVAFYPISILPSRLSKNSRTAD